MSQYMKNHRFIYLSYKMRDFALEVSDANRNWKSIWFFIRPMDLEVDWVFPIIWDKTTLQDHFDQFVEVLTGCN